LADHAAGNPVAGVSGRIGHVVPWITTAVPSGWKTELGLAISMVIAALISSSSSAPFGGMCKFGKSPGRAQHDAVMGVARIEMRTRRIERGQLALAHGMNMEGMLARRHSLERELEQTPAGVCNRETVPTSWRFVSLSSALADWAAAGRTSAVASKAVTLTVRAHFMFMPWSPRRCPSIPIISCACRLTSRLHRF
jgi:hypothetical protein